MFYAQKNHYYFLKPNEGLTDEIAVINEKQIFDNYGEDLNNHIKIIVCEVDGKRHVIRKGFLVG